MAKRDTPLDKVRIDKWLWSVRIFKSRTLASDVCKQGHVKFGSKTLKPSSSISRGDELRVRRNGYDMRYRVLELIEKRVGAPVAITCYEDITPEEELRKFDDWFIGKNSAEVRDKGTGRPTKRERRDLEGFKDVDANYDWGWIDEDDEKD